MKSKRSPSMPIKLLAVLGVALILAYCGYLTLLYLRQDAMVFPGHQATPERIAEMRRYYPQLVDFAVKAADGTPLAGFFVERSKDDHPAPVVLYFTGNAEDEAGFFLWAPGELRDFSLAGIDYRGYGASQGKPSEALVKADALTVYDALSDKIGRDTPIFVMGRSLGSGVALHVAANRPVAGLILVTPYDSLASVGQQAHPFVPVTLLMRHPFRAIDEAAKVSAPTLFLVAGADTLIPPVHAERLAAAWKGPKDYETIAGATHGTIIDKPQYWERIRSFLTTLERK